MVEQDPDAKSKSKGKRPKDWSRAWWKEQIWKENTKVDQGPVGRASQKRKKQEIIQAPKEKSKSKGKNQEVV